MKKKGLIISTIVMVVVLIAALTTSTYAWFRASSEVKVDSITLSITSDAKVNVGVKTSAMNNVLVNDEEGEGKHTENSSTSYRYESVAPVAASGNTIDWGTSGTEGLGQILNFSGLALGVSKAIGTATGSAGSFVIDSATNAFDISHTIIKAPGDGTTVSDTQADIEVANANVDYLHAVIGVEANKDGMKGMFVKVVVKTTDKKTTLGMNAALHFIIKTAEGTINYEPFRGYNYKTTKKSESLNESSQTAGIVTYDSTNKQFVSTFYFWVAQKEQGFATGGQDIRDFEIYAFIQGTDTDCNNNALGTSCTIDISFDATTNITYIDNDTTTVASVKFLSFS